MKKQSLIFSSLLALALTMLVSVSASAQAPAQAFDPLIISGPITAYTPADCGRAGSITIADQTLVIAAGVNTVFFDTMQVIAANGGLTLANVKSEPWQIVTSPATVRGIGVYLDPQNRIRKQALATANTTRSRIFDVTGVVTAFTPATATSNGSITIKRLTFQIAPGTTVPAVVGNISRIRGDLNTSNQIATAFVIDPFRKLTVCGAPAALSSGLSFEVSDVNPFDPAGFIAGEVFVFNPLGSAGGQILCDESVDVMRADGAANIFFAPNFSIRNLISKDVNACYELNMDAFNWASNGSKLITSANPQYGTVSGVLSGISTSQITNPPSQPTQVLAPGTTSITISGITFTIAGNNLLTLLDPFVQADLTSGTTTVCLKQVIDPAGQSGTPTASGPGTFTRPGALQLINGTTLKKGACQ